MAKERSLEATSTWAVAVICFVLVAISIVIEHVIHKTGSWLKKKKKPSLYEALDKVKAELMLVGFISLLLTVSQDYIARICLPRTVAHSWHPCRYDGNDEKKYADSCLAKGKVQLVSAYGIHQLHIFIFVLAISHIIYSIVTFGLGILKMRRWKSWENETKTIQYEYYHDPERFRFARDTSFGRRHLHFWSKSSVLLWIVCFFRQFFKSVEKVDYLTLRHGFIIEHLTPQSQKTFDFQKYIKRSLENDFKILVGISPILWFLAVLLLLTNTHGWYSHFWLPFIPLIILLLIGAKLQVIIAKMGIRILDRGDVIKGTPVVHLGDDLFWFNRPGLILLLIHLILFENAFQLAFFAWSWYEYGYPSCYHENLEDLLIRLLMGIVVQVLCSYVTLPLYALVTQMGSKMKPAIFSEPVASALRKWHHGAKKQLKHGHGRPSASTTPFSSQPTSPMQGGMSPMYLLRGQTNYSEGEHYAASPRASDFGGHEGWGREGTTSNSPPAPSRNMRNGAEDDVTRYESEIEADIENPSCPPEVESVRSQHDVRKKSSSDFSFPNEKLSYSSEA